MIANGRIQLFPLLRLALMLIVGIVMGDALWGMVPVWWWMAATIALLGLTCCLWQRPIVQSCGLLLSAMLLGSWIVSVKLQNNTVSLPKEYVNYKGVVMSRPVRHGKIVMCDMLVCEGPFAGRKIKASILRDTVEHRYETLAVGEVILAKSVWKEPQGFHGQPNFDYHRWMQVHGFIARTFIYYKDWKKSTSTLAQLSRLQRAEVRLLRFRERLRKPFDEVTTDQQAAAVVAAMSLGDKAELSKDLRDIYSVTGASHVLALSGLHLGIIYFLLTFLFAAHRNNLLSQALAIAAIWGYTMMVGLTSSVVRAATMYTLLALITVLQRDKTSLNTLSFAAIAMLIANPLTLWDVSFQLSFMAVLGITLFYKKIYSILHPWWLNRHRITKWVWSMVCLSFSAQVIVTPLIVFYFGRISCYSLLTNLVAIPLTTIIIYGAVLAFFLAPFTTLQIEVMKLVVSIAGVLNDCLAWISRIPGASIENVRLNILQVALLYVLLACCYGLCIYFVRMYRSAHGNPWGNFPH